MNNLNDEFWGFSLGRIDFLEIKNISLIKMENKFGAGISFNSRRAALEYLANHLNNLLKESESDLIIKNCDCPTLITWSDV